METSLPSPSSSPVGNMVVDRYKGGPMGLLEVRGRKYILIYDGDRSSWS